MSETRFEQRISALIVGGFGAVESPILPHLLSRADYVIGVDLGAAACASAGREPDLAIGDFDSIDPEALARLRTAGVRIEALPQAKDITDLEAALALCEREGIERVTVTAVTGGRADHELAVWGVLSRHPALQPVIEEPGLRGWIMDAKSGRSSLTLDGPGPTVSIIPTLGPAQVTINGFRFGDGTVALRPLDDRGVSNEITAVSAGVSVLSGTVAVFMNLDE